MRTSRAICSGIRLAAFIGLSTLLAACVGLGGANDAAPREIQVTSDAVTITGPRGFCVDPMSTRRDGDTGFVLLGNCAAISGRVRAPQPDVPAVLTAAVAARSADGGSLTANLDALDTFFRSDAGRGLLSRAGDPETVTILETRVSGGLFLLHARDTSAGAVVGVAPDYWRAYLDIGPRLESCCVVAGGAGDVTHDAALQVLTAFASAVQGANSVATNPANAAELPQAQTQAGGGLFREGLFQRIFR